MSRAVFFVAPPRNGDIRHFQGEMTRVPGASSGIGDIRHFQGEMSRVGPAVARRASHGSGRARLAHPALQVETFAKGDHR